MGCRLVAAGLFLLLFLAAAGPAAADRRGGERDWADGGRGDEGGVLDDSDPSPDPDTSPSLSLDLSPLPSPDVQLSPSPDVQPSPSPDVQPSPSPDVQPSPSPDVQPSPSPDVQPSPSPDVQPSPSPDVQPSPSPDVQPSPRPDVQPTPDPTPSPSPDAQLSPSPDPPGPFLPLAGDAPQSVAPAAAGSWWVPRLGYKFQYILKQVFNPQTDFINGVQVYLFDGWEATPSVVAAVKARGCFAICYFSAGSYENWRSDAGKFQSGDYKNPLQGWPGEYWINVRSANVKTIMAARIQMCKDKGFDGIDPDNIDGYQNPTGLSITYAEQVAYNRWIASTAHSIGLAAGLKNDVGQITDLVGDFDYFINEQCAQFDECTAYAPAKAAGKPVWNVEYKLANFQKACPNNLAWGIRSLYKADPDLSNDWQECVGVAYPDADPPAPGTGGGVGARLGNGSWWSPLNSDGLQLNYLIKQPSFSSSYILSGTQVYLLNGPAAAAADAAALTGAGLYPVCWFSAATALKPSAKKRSAASRRSRGLEPAAALNLGSADYGKRKKGSEYYVDINSDAVKAAMSQIISDCKSKGFIGIAAGNLDAWARNTGLDYSEADMVAYMQWLAKTAHELGLGAGMDGDSTHAAQMANTFDFFVAQECARFKNCADYSAVQSAGRPIFDVEYSKGALLKACRCAGQRGLTIISKARTQLSAPRSTCPATVKGACRL